MAVAALQTGMLAPMWGIGAIDKTNAAFKQAWDHATEWYKMPYKAAAQVASDFKEKVRVHSVGNTRRTPFEERRG